jgi:hypothetical protein
MMGGEKIAIYTQTGRLRWLQTGVNKTLQYELRDFYSGKLIWEDIPTVMQGDDNGNDYNSR